MKRLLRSTMLAATLGALGMGASAADEVEQNHPIQSAQRLIIPPSGAITVNGVIGTVTGAAALDVDFYSFWGKAGDTIAVDIDGGMNAGARNVDDEAAEAGPKASRFFQRAGDQPAVEGGLRFFEQGQVLQTSLLRRLDGQRPGDVIERRAARHDSATGLLAIAFAAGVPERLHG